MKEETQDTEETKENKSKLNSRKFAVFLCWSVLIVALVVIGFIRNNDEIILKAMEYYFIISAVYIGFNVWNKKIITDKESQAIKGD